MATRSASLPIEQTYLAKARLVVLTVVLVAAVVVTIAVAFGRSTAAGGTGLGPVRDYGPVTVRNEPLVVNGSVAGSSVFIDGRRAGMAPVQVELAKGKHAVRMTHDGYRPAPWHFLYFLPLPHGQGAFRGTFPLLACNPAASP